MYNYHNDLPVITMTAAMAMLKHSKVNSKDKWRIHDRLQAIAAEEGHVFTGYDYKLTLSDTPCDHCSGTATYRCSENKKWCSSCWTKALDRTVRSIKKRPPLPGSKHWVGKYNYRMLHTK